MYGGAFIIAGEWLGFRKILHLKIPREVCYLAFDMEIYLNMFVARL